MHIAIYFNFLIINIYVCVCGIVLVLFFSFSISMEIFCFFLFFRKSEKSRPLMLVPNIFSMNNRSSYFFFFCFPFLFIQFFFLTSFTMGPLLNLWHIFVNIKNNNSWILMVSHYRYHAEKRSICRF